MKTDIASDYVRRNFEPNDRLAVVLVNKRAGVVVQRIATAERIASPEFQAWLRHENTRHYEIYMSMNTLREGASGRTKADIAAVRHVYLDLDQNADESLRFIFHRADLPVPSFIVNTSANKWQVIWKVENFTKDEAEDLQKALARETGADVAATDCTRVLRLPGFYNHKYGPPYLVRMEPHSALVGEVYRPEHFPQLSHPAKQTHGQPSDRRSGPIYRPGKLSQSERDWAYAKRALARGDPENMVIAAIASCRRYHKHNPQYYAELTVRKAAQSLEADRSQVSSSSVVPER